MRYILAILFDFFGVGLCSRVFVDFRTRGVLWSVGFNRDEINDVDAVDARSTGSLITHVR